ncbi:hypothetical protein [Amycolatopsis sp. NPDC003731]
MTVYPATTGRTQLRTPCYPLSLFGMTDLAAGSHTVQVECTE